MSQGHGRRGPLVPGGRRGDPPSGSGVGRADRRRSRLRPADPLRPERGRRARPHRLRHPAARDPRRVRPRPDQASWLASSVVARRSRWRCRSRSPSMADRHRRVPVGARRRGGLGAASRSMTGLASTVVVPRRRPGRLGHRQGRGRPDPQLAARRLLPARQPARVSTRSTGRPTPSGQFVGPLLAGLLAYWFELAGAVHRLRHPHAHPRDPRPADAGADPGRAGSGEAMGAADGGRRHRGGAAVASPRPGGSCWKIDRPPAHLVRPAVPGRVAHRLRLAWPRSSTRRSSASTRWPGARSPPPSSRSSSSA